MRGTEDMAVSQDEEVNRKTKAEEVNEFLKYDGQETVESIKKLCRRITWIEGKNIQQ